MNILWVKVGGLWPLNIGGRLRSHHMIRELSKRHRVTVLTTHAPGEDAEAVRESLPHCARVESFPFAAPKKGTLRFVGALAQSWLSPLPVDLYKWRVPQLQREVARRFASGEVDLCVADFLHAIPNLPSTWSVPVVLFEHNVESMIWSRLADTETRPVQRALLKIEAGKMQRVERDACARSARVIAVSPTDAAQLGHGASAIPTGVDTSFFNANGTPEKPHHLAFTGAMDWYPNEDAMLYFMSDVLPRIRGACNDVTMTIVGRNPSQRLREAAAAAGVAVTGTVDDVRSFIDEAAVYIVPLRVGGGTRLKIFEALSMGKPVVSTAVGAEGLPLADGEHFVSADSPAEFSDAVVSLLRDPQRRNAIGNAGRTLVRERYSWSSVADAFEQCVNTKHI